MGPARFPAALRRAGHRRRAEAGTSSYELVLLMPVLVLMVLFVLWAGRTGQARLAADLAAEEAVTAAAVCCGPDEIDRREQVVDAILNGRPELDFLCIHGARPLDGAERFVSDTAFYFDGSAGSTTGVGVLGLGFGCLTDGAVSVLGGILPETEIRARASEVVLLEPRAGGTLTVLPRLTVDDVRVNEAFGALTFRLQLDRSADEGNPVSVWWQTAPYNTGPDPVGNATAANVDENFERFDYCADEIDRELATFADPADYDPAGYAIRHRDYLQAGAGRARIEPGETSETIRIDINDDCLYEGDERLKVELFDENANVIVTDREAVGVIDSEDDPPFLGFLDTGRMSPEAPVTPGELFREVQLDLVLRNEFDQRIVSGLLVRGTVVTADDTASAEAQGNLCPPDYVALPSTGQDGSFTILALHSGPAPPLIVHVLDDAIDEGNETFTVRINSVWGAKFGSLGAMTITIDDDDPPPFLHLVEPDDGLDDRIIELRESEVLPAMAILLTDADANEIGSGLDVDFTYDGADGSAVAGADFALPDSLPPDGFTVEACHSASALGTPVTVDILNDDDPEPPEQFTVSLRSLDANANDTEAGSSLVVWILDDDVERVPTVTDADGVVPVTDCIDPNDPHQPPPTLIFDDQTVGEADGELGVYLRTSRQLCEALDVELLVDSRSGVDTATPGGSPCVAAQDFTRVNGTLSIGRDSRLFVPICDDDVTESDETFSITAQWSSYSAPLHYQAQPPVLAVVTIVDDDPCGAVDPDDANQAPPTITVHGTSGREGTGVPDGAIGGLHLVEVTLSAPLCRAVPIEIGSRNATATRGYANHCFVDPGQTVLGDYYLPETLDVTDAEEILISGRSPVYTGVAVCQDDVVEGDETFQITARWADTAPPHYRLVAEVTGEFTIVDDDLACIDITDSTQAAPLITVHRATFDEGDGAVSVEVTLSEPLCAPVDIVLTPTSGTASLANASTCGFGDDVLGSPSTVPTIGARPARLRLSLCPDTVPEAAETFTVGAGWAAGAPAHFPPGEVASNAITIRDDD